MKGIKKEDLMCEVVMFSTNKVMLAERYSPPLSRKNCSTLYFWHIEQKMSTNIKILKKKKKKGNTKKKNQKTPHQI